MQLQDLEQEQRENPQLTTLSSSAAENEEPAIFDHETGLERIMGDRNLFTIMLKVFLDSCIETKQNISSSRLTQNCQNCTEILHKVKGAAATISADALSLEAAILGREIERQKSCAEIDFNDFLQILDLTSQKISNYLQNIN